jgi:hypothetical protein
MKVNDRMENQERSKDHLTSYEASTAVKMLIAVFWFVVSRCLVRCYLHSQGAYLPSSE